MHGSPRPELAMISSWCVQHGRCNHGRRARGAPRLVSMPCCRRGVVRGTCAAKASKVDLTTRKCCCDGRRKLAQCEVVSQMNRFENGGQTHLMLTVYESAGKACPVTLCLCPLRLRLALWRTCGQAASAQPARCNVLAASIPSCALCCGQQWRATAFA